MVIARSVQEPSGAQLLEPTPKEQASFEVGNDIKLLSKDIDKHDFSYRCKILEVCNKSLKVQLNDKKNEEGSGTLEVHNFVNFSHKLKYIF